MNHAMRRVAYGFPSDADALALRAAGLRVTSTRLAALRLAPAVMARHGHVNHQLLHAAAQQAGYTFSPTAFYAVLPKLASAGLLPRDGLVPTRRKGQAFPPTAMCPGE